MPETEPTAELNEGFSEPGGCNGWRLSCRRRCQRSKISEFGLLR